MRLVPSLQFTKQTDVRVWAVIFEVLFRISSCSEEREMLRSFISNHRVKSAVEEAEHIPLYMY